MKDWAFNFYIFLFQAFQKSCHQLPERSFHIGNWQFPFCARCTGVIIGHITMIVLLLCGIRTHLAFDLLSLFLLFIDWGLQYIKVLPSNNIRRIITGFLGGLAVISLIFKLISYLYLLIF